MARIPAYHQDLRAHVHPLAPTENPQAGRVAGQAGRLLGEFAHKLDQARVGREISAAQNDAYDRLQGLKTQITESGNWQASGDTWRNGVDKIRANLQKQHPHVWDRVSPSFDRATITGKYDVDRWAWRHEQDHSRAQLYGDTKANVNRMANASTPEERQLYRDQIAHDTAAAAGNFVTEVQADRIRDDAYADVAEVRAEKLIESNPAQAVTALKGKSEFTDLSPEKRLALTNRAERALEQQQARARAELQGRLADDLSSIEHTGQGVPGIDEQMAAAGYTPEQIAEHEKRQHMAHVLHDTLQGVTTDTPQQMLDRVNQLKPEPGAEDYEAKFQLWTKAQAAVGRTLELRHADPAGAAAAATPPHPHDTEEQQITYLLAQQTAMGIPEAEQRPLPKATAKARVKQWKEAAPDEKVALLDAWQKADGKHFMGVLKQLMAEGLPLGAAVMQHVSSDVRDDLAQASAVSDSQLRKQLGGSTAAIDDEVDKQLGDFLHTLPPNIALRGRYAELARHMAHFYAARGDDEPAAEAVDGLFGNYFDYVGTLRVPKGRGYDPAKLANYGDWVLKHLEGRDLNDRGQPPLFFEDRAYHEGHWITDTDGNTATLYIDHAPVTYRDGRPVKLYFDHAANFDYAAHAEPGKSHLQNTRSRTTLFGFTFHSPLAYSEPGNTPVKAPKAHVKSEAQAAPGGLLANQGQTFAGNRPPPPAPPGAALPWLRKLAQWTEPDTAAFRLLKHLIDEADGKKAKEKTK